MIFFKTKIPLQPLHKLHTLKPRFLSLDCFCSGRNLEEWWQKLTNWIAFFCYHIVDCDALDHKNLCTGCPSSIITTVGQLLSRWHAVSSNLKSVLSSNHKKLIFYPIFSNVFQSQGPEEFDQIHQVKYLDSCSCEIKYSFSFISLFDIYFFEMLSLFWLQSNFFCFWR